jgi:hypothetical protein
VDDERGYFGCWINIRGIVFSTSQLITAAAAILKGPAPRKSFEYAVYAWGACSAPLLLLSAFRIGVVFTVAGILLADILMSPVFALFFLPMSRLTLAVAVASSVFLFAMTSSIAFEGKIHAVFVCTTG